MDTTNTFRIADHTICLTFKAGSNSIELLPALMPFRTGNDDTTTHLFSLTVDDALRPSRKRQLVRTFDTGNGDTTVFKLTNGGYQYIIRDIKGRDCCLLEAGAGFSQCSCALNGTEDMRSFGLNNALMLTFAFASSKHSTLLIHASCVSNSGCAYPFIAKSGTGKSTHTSLWMKNIESTELLNDDNPIVRIVDGKTFVYGSPWSGKTPCYRNTSCPLGAITRIERATQNSIERLKPSLAFASLLPACSSMKWDNDIYDNICDTLTRIIETTPIYTLHCLPDDEAALLCHKTITTKND